MSLEGLEDEGLQKNPDLGLAQLKFLLTQESHANDAGVRKELIDGVTNSSKFSCPTVRLLQLQRNVLA